MEWVVPSHQVASFVEGHKYAQLPGGWRVFPSPLGMSPVQKSGQEACLHPPALHTAVATAQLTREVAVGSYTGH